MKYLIICLSLILFSLIMVVIEQHSEIEVDKIIGIGVSILVITTVLFILVLDKILKYAVAEGNKR